MMKENKQVEDQLHQEIVESVENEAKDEQESQNNLSL